MSMEISSSESVCYVHCSFCNTILAVSVPCCGLYNYATVRCGHCANLLSVNIGLPPPTPPLQENFQLLRQQHYNYQEVSKDSSSLSGGSSSSSTITNIASDSHEDHQSRPLPIRPPEKRQRVPSAYNKFIKEEIQRLKACNPEISHREAFSAAAKNWAHFPHIHFGLNLDGQRQARLDHAIAGEGTTNKSHGFY